MGKNEQSWATVPLAEKRDKVPVTNKYGNNVILLRSQNKMDISGETKKVSRKREVKPRNEELIQDIKKLIDLKIAVFGAEYDLIRNQVEEMAEKMGKKEKKEVFNYLDSAKEKEENKKKKEETEEYFRENNFKLDPKIRFIKPDSENLISVYTISPDGRPIISDNRIGLYKPVDLDYFKEKIIGEGYVQREQDSEAENKIRERISEIRKRAGLMPEKLKKEKFIAGVLKDEPDNGADKMDGQKQSGPEKFHDRKEMLEKGAEDRKRYLDSMLDWVETNKEEIYRKIFQGIKAGSLVEGDGGGQLGKYYAEYEESRLDDAGKKEITQKITEIEKVVPTYIAILRSLDSWQVKKTGENIPEMPASEKISPEMVKTEQETIAPEPVAEKIIDEEKKETTPQLEISGQTEERRERIEFLRKEVEKRRKEYLEVDYEEKNVAKRAWGFFKSLTRNREEEGKNFERNAKVAQARAYYDDILMQYKNAIIEDAKIRNATDKELLDIAKIFQTEAAPNIAVGVNEVRIEYQEGRFSSFIKEHSFSLFERYNKLSPATKLAAGAAFGLSALGAGYLGGMTAEVAGSAVLARRAFLGFVTGVSTYLSAKNISGGKEGIMMQKEMEELEKKMKNFEIFDEKLKFVNQTADKKIKDENNKIGQIKNRNLRHLAYGVGAGTVSALIPKLTKMFSEGTGVGSWVKEHIFGKIPYEVPDVAEHTPGTEVSPEAPAGPEIGIGPEITTGNPIELKVGIGKTGSLWGTLNEYFKGMGLSVEDAAKKSSTLAREYIKERGLENGNIIHEGAEIKLDPIGSKIIEITDSRFGDSP